MAGEWADSGPLGIGAAIYTLLVLFMSTAKVMVDPDEANQLIVLDGICIAPYPFECDSDTFP